MLYRVSPELADKLKAIAYWDRKKKNDIGVRALAKYVKKWEDKNGQVRPIPDEEEEETAQEIQIDIVNQCEEGEVPLPPLRKRIESDNGLVRAYQRMNGNWNVKPVKKRVDAPFKNLCKSAKNEEAAIIQMELMENSIMQLSPKWKRNGAKKAIQINFPK